MGLLYLRRGFSGKPKNGEPPAVLSALPVLGLQPKEAIPPTFLPEAFLFALWQYIMEVLVGYDLTGDSHLVYFQRIEQRFGPGRRLRRKERMRSSNYWRAICLEPKPPSATDTQIISVEERPRSQARFGRFECGF